MTKWQKDLGETRLRLVKLEARVLAFAQANKVDPQDNKEIWKSLSEVARYIWKAEGIAEAYASRNTAPPMYISAIAKMNKILRDAEEFETMLHLKTQSHV